MGEPVGQLAGKLDPDALFGIETSLRGTAILMNRPPFGSYPSGPAIYPCPNY